MSELPGGWSLDDLSKIAQHTVYSQRGLLLEWDEALDVAACGLIERIYAEPTPTRFDLFDAARYALASANRREASFRGLDTHMARNQREGAPRRYATYWYGRTALVAPFEEQVLERLAVRQLWAQLSPRHREALAALIEAGTYEGAAAVLGVAKSTWHHRIADARKEARLLWYAPETPGRQWAADHPGKVGTDPRNKGLMAIQTRRRRLKETAA